jgi:amino acid transporter
MSRNRDAPEALERTSDRGAPWVGVLLAFVVGLIFFLPFPGWQKLVTFITSATVLSFGTGPLVWAALRKQLPDHERPFRLPGGHVIPVLAFFSSNVIVYWAGWNTNWKLFVAILLGLVLLAAYRRFSSRPHQSMDWRAGAWLIPWLGGLALISFLGSYGKGSQDVFGLGTGVLVIAVFSAIIYVMAYRMRLPSERTKELTQAGA